MVGGLFRFREPETRAVVGATWSPVWLSSKCQVEGCSAAAASSLINSSASGGMLGGGIFLFRERERRKEWFMQCFGWV